MRSLGWALWTFFEIPLCSAHLSQRQHTNTWLSVCIHGSKPAVRRWSSLASSAVAPTLDSWHDTLALFLHSNSWTRQGNFLCPSLLIGITLRWDVSRCIRSPFFHLHLHLFNESRCLAFLLTIRQSHWDRTLYFLIPFSAGTNQYTNVLP